ncbi:unnamed protein product [Linum trigynum]|uniref:Uncharacterized protein n=1 Tax=Linum trigynum TaxID=586398 RepID=A0AAV2FRC4_9ROSI
MQVEEEEEEGNHEDVEEHTEVVTEFSHDNHDQVYPLVVDHNFPHFRSDMLGPSEEMQSELIENLAWRLVLQSVMEEEKRERVRKEVVEDEEERKEEVVLDLFQGERPHFKKGRVVEEASGVQAKDEVEVEEACIVSIIQVISPPNFEEVLSKDPFAVSLCQTKATSTSVPLSGRDGGQSIQLYLVWGNETREETRKRSRGWRLQLHQVHEPSSPATPPARDLRLHLKDENLNFKEFLAWTETYKLPSGSRRERSACWEATQLVGLHFFPYLSSVESVLFFDFRVNISTFVRFCVVFVFRLLSPPIMHRLPSPPSFTLDLVTSFYPPYLSSIEDNVVLQCGGMFDYVCV